MGRWWQNGPLENNGVAHLYGFVGNHPASDIDKFGQSEVTGNFVGMEFDAFVDLTSISARMPNPLLAGFILAVSNIIHFSMHFCVLKFKDSFDSLI